MDDMVLTAEQEAEVARIVDIIMAGARAEAVTIARLLVSRENREFFGETEFQIRDKVLGIGARAIDAGLAARKKKGIEGRPASARSARKPRNSRAIEAAR